MSLPELPADGLTVADLQKQVLAEKARQRRRSAQAPILEKLRILEEMRDFTLLLKASRDENKARLKAAWARDGSGKKEVRYEGGSGAAAAP